MFSSYNKGHILGSKNSKKVYDSYQKPGGKPSMPMECMINPLKSTVAIWVQL